MKTVIKFPITSVASLKKLAKLVMRIDGYESLNEAQEALASHLKMGDWHQAMRTLEGGTPIVAPGSNQLRPNTTQEAKGRGRRLRHDGDWADIVHVDQAVAEALGRRDETLTTVVGDVFGYDGLERELRRVDKGGQFDMAAVEATGSLKFDIFDLKGVTKAARERGDEDRKIAAAAKSAGEDPMDAVLENDVVRAMRFYGLSLTPQQVRDVYKRFPELYKDAKKNGIDTVSRDGFIEKMVAFIGASAEWPTGGTPTAEQVRFFNDFAACCEKHGVAFDLSVVVPATRDNAPEIL